MRSVARDTLEDLDFWAFTVAFGTSQSIANAVESQLAEWWKNGIDDYLGYGSLAPLQLQKEYNPASKIVAVYAVDSASPVTLVETNLNDGYSSLSRMLSRRLPTTTFAVVRSKPVGRSEWPVEEFGLINESSGGFIRHVCAALDSGGWIFENSGGLLGFEQPEQYRRRRISDRFTRVHIVEFLGHLGLDIFSLANPECYKLVKCLSEARSR